MFLALVDFSSKMASIWAPEASKRAQEAAKSPQDGSRGSQDGLQMAPGGPPEASKTAPKTRFCRSAPTNCRYGVAMLGACARWAVLGLFLGRFGVVSRSFSSPFDAQPAKRHWQYDGRS